MNWFRSSLKGQVKALSADIAEAYAERAQLAFQILSMKPDCSVHELAVCWAVTAEQISKPEDQTEQSDPSNNLVKSLPTVTRAFFDSFCQDFMENVLESDLKLSLDSQEIRALAGPTLDAMDVERAEQLGKLIGAVASNATKLSSATMLILQKGLRKQEASAALKDAVTLVRRRSDLNQFEKSMAEEWIAASGLSWPSST